MESSRGQNEDVRSRTLSFIVRNAENMAHTFASGVQHGDEDLEGSRGKDDDVASTIGPLRFEIYWLAPCRPGREKPQIW